jgi:hypothetical protein
MKEPTKPAQPAAVPCGTDKAAGQRSKPLTRSEEARIPDKNVANLKIDPSTEPEISWSDFCNGTHGSIAETYRK